MRGTLSPWIVRELPVGPSEFQTERTEEILQFTDVWYAEIKGSKGLFDVFVSYWAPGTFEERQVGGHTPDACWPANGWRIVDRLSERWPGAQTGQGIGPWEYRRFSPPDHSIQRDVIFTHVADGQHTRYAVRRKRFSESLPVILAQGGNSRPEQLFVRVSWSSDHPAPYEDPAFRALVEQLTAVFWAPDNQS